MPLFRLWIATGSVPHSHGRRARWCRLMGDDWRLHWRGCWLDAHHTCHGHCLLLWDVKWWWAMVLTLLTHSRYGSLVDFVTKHITRCYTSYFSCNRWTTKHFNSRAVLWLSGYGYATNFGYVLGLFYQLIQLITTSSLVQNIMSK
jgi:hypothetical protein